ncbi:MAG: protein phosphatase 2C domain-containing protein [Anaerolineae bacterium]|nr:protein phosphatase 2C domain-containing protein [Anaerolineae bacterium]
MRLDVGYVTEPGKTRKDNQDRLAVPPAGLKPVQVARNGFLCLVADGMGGYHGGEQASEIAVARMMREYYAAPRADVAVGLAQAIQAANNDILQAKVGHPEVEKMGTTIAAVVVRGEELYLANVGDSHIYLVRQGEVQRLSQEHTVAADLLQSGVLRQSDLNGHDMRGILSRAVGIQPSAEPYVGPPQKLLPGDRIVLCTDGLSNLVSPTEIASVVMSSRTMQQAARRLTDLANQRGSPDNVTVLALRAGGGVSSTVVLPAVLGGAGLTLVVVVALVITGKPPETTPAPTASMVAVTAGTITPESLIAPTSTSVVSGSVASTREVGGTPVDQPVTPAPTNTGVPRPTFTFTPRPPAPTPSSTPLAAPSITFPPPGFNTFGGLEILWDWEPTLRENWRYDVRFFRAGEATPFYTELRQERRAGIKVDEWAPGEVFITVRVVEVDDEGKFHEVVVSHESEPLRVQVVRSQPEPPTPTPTPSRGN